MEFEPIFFIDDDKNLSNSQIDNIPVLSLELGTKLIETKKVKIVFFAISNISTDRKMSIFNSLEKLNIELKVLPRIDEINGKKLALIIFLIFQLMKFYKEKKYHHY